MTRGPRIFSSSVTTRYPRATGGDRSRPSPQSCLPPRSRGDHCRDLRRLRQARRRQKLRRLCRRWLPDFPVSALLTLCHRVISVSTGEPQSRLLRTGEFEQISPLPAQKKGSLISRLCRSKIFGSIDVRYANSIFGTDCNRCFCFYFPIGDFREMVSAGYGPMTCSGCPMAKFLAEPSRNLCGLTAAPKRWPV